MTIKKKEETHENASKKEMESNEKKKGTKGLYVLTILLMMVMLSCTALSAFAFMNSKTSLDILNKNFSETEETQENDVKISETYYIRSTENISDAYKSGDTSMLNDKDKETLDMARAILKKIVKKGMNDFEKEKAVYDWMVKNLSWDGGLLTVIPTTGADCDNPYGVLKYHSAICVGYATTFRMFMQMLDIPCMVVHNYSKYHSWDLVKLGDNWYHTDIYSDVGSTNYRNFNLNDSMMSKSQSWDTDFFPAALSLEYNMTYLNCKTDVDIYEIPEMVKGIVDEKAETISIKYGPDFTEKDARTIERIVESIREVLYCSEKYENTYVSFECIPIGDDGYIICINSENDDVGEEEILSEEEKEKIDKTVERIFEDILF